MLVALSTGARRTPTERADSPTRALEEDDELGVEGKFELPNDELDDVDEGLLEDDELPRACTGATEEDVLNEGLEPPFEPSSSSQFIVLAQVDPQDWLLHFKISDLHHLQHLFSISCRKRGLLAGLPLPSGRHRSGPRHAFWPALVDKPSLAAVPVEQEQQRFCKLLCMFDKVIHPEAKYFVVGPPLWRHTHRGPLICLVEDALRVTAAGSMCILAAFRAQDLRCAARRSDVDEWKALQEPL